MKKIFSIVILTLTIMCGVIFAGCGPSYSSLSLSFSSEKIEMLRTDKSESYSLTVENYFDFDAQFNFSFEKPIAIVVDGSLKHIGDGVFTFSIAPLIAGETDLCITLRGTGKQITIPVYIKEDIVGFEPVENIFAIRGGNLSLDESLFTFTPVDTTEKSFTYELTEEYLEVDGISLQNNVLSIENNVSTQAINEIVLLVTSKSKPELSKTITVKLVNEVDVSSLNVVSYGMSKDEDNNIFFDSEKSVEIINLGVQSENVVELVINKELEFQKQINIQFEKWDEYLMDVYTKDGIDGDLSKINPITNKNGNFEFAIQVSEIGEYSFTVKIYQSDFALNFKEFEVKINATSTPTSIKINGQNNIGLVEFYTYGSEPRDFNFSIFPESSLKGTNYTYNLELFSYTGDTYPTVIASDDEKFTKQTSLPTQHLQISYDGEKVKTLDDILNMEKLSYLTLKPMGAYEHSYAFRITCLNGSEELCSNVMYVKIYIGATEFGLDEKVYEDNTIYIDIAGGSVVFNDFIYTEGSTIGYLTIMQKHLEESVCDIEQLTYSEDIIKPTLKITPKKVGVTEYSLITPNGIPASFKVVVVRLIEAKDFTITLTNENSNNISSFETTSNGSLLNVVVKGNKEKEIISGIAYTEAKILNYVDTNSFSYSYEMFYEGRNYEVVNNRIIKAKAFTEAEVILVKTKIAKIDNFKLTYDSYDYDFSISCIQYIKKLSITTNNSLDETNRVKYVSVYDKNLLSYKNQNMAEAYIYMSLEYSGGTVYNSEDITLESWSIMGLSYDKEQDVYAKENNLNSYSATVGSIGYFYPNYIEDAEYVGKFICDITGINSITSFTITLSMIDNNTKQEFTDTITITIEKYIDVDSLWLKTGTDSIYLDNTAENNTKSISVYVMPVDATYQEIAISVETTYTNCIDWQYVGDVITFKFVSAGSGNIYIYPVSKMKVSNEIPEYNICLPFICADGTSEDKALKLTTYEDLMSIKSDRHYFLDSIIDCGERELHIKEFNASIRGTFLCKDDERFSSVEQVGGITNFVVTDNSTNNYGLFGVLGVDAVIYNLEIKGIFKNSENNEAYVFNLSNNTNIGLFVGTNNGTILNVNVGLYRQNTLYLESKKSDIELNVGFVAGLNAGNIIVDANAKNSTLFASNTEESQFVSQIIGDFKEANFGAVAGFNGSNATIEYMQGVYGTLEEVKEDFISLGLYGASVNILAKLYNFGSVGGVVGHNNGKIINCKVLGEISRLKYEETSPADSNVGGIIGLQSGIVSVENNKSRIFVRGTGNVSGLIGRIIVGDISNIKNNKVQATDTGRMGINATLVVGLQLSSKVYEVSDVDLKNYNNNAYSYISREKVLDEHLTNNLDISKYYGDMLIVSSLDSNATIYNSYEFADGVDDADFSQAIKYFALAVYKQAYNELEQQYINNEILTENVLKIANITAKEVNIDVNNIAIANIINYGKKLNLYNTGLITITISSALNYKNSCSISVYFTNYYDNIKIYSNKDKTQEMSYLDLYNGNVSNVYFDCYANDYNNNYERIRLIGNNEIEFEFDNNEKLNIISAKQILFVNAQNNIDNNTEILVYPVLKINGLSYYQYEEDSFKVFKQINEDSKQKVDIDVRITTGIDSVRLSKTYVMAEPTDVVSFEVVYVSYNEEDKLIPSLKIGKNTYLIDENGYFIDSIGTKLFKLTKESEDTLISENTYKVIYSLSMVLSEEVYYKMGFNIDNKIIELTLKSEKTNKEGLIQIEYSPETISSVIVNNYSYEENEGMIGENENSLMYYEDYAISSSAYASTGDINILSAYVFTNLSEFSYVEVEMDVGQSGGYLAYVDNNGKISKNGFITSLGNVVTLRLYKENLIEKDELFIDNVVRSLKINIMYSLPQNLSDQTYVPIVFNFYKEIKEADDSITAIHCYTKETTVISKAAKQVSFTIYGKTSNSGSRKEYNVARGMTYALETTIIGYTDSEVCFEISDPSIASVEQISGIYYLKISTNKPQYKQGESGYNVTIKSYGQKNTNNMLLKSREQVTELYVYEVCLDDEPFTDDNIELKVLQTTDVKEIIKSKINLESNNNLVYSTYNSVKENIAIGATYTLIYGNEEVTLVDNISSDKIPNLLINGYTLMAKALLNNMDIKMRVEFQYEYLEGIPVISSEGIQYSKEFKISSYLSTSEEVPDPIFSYQDMLNVKSDENYRLVNDIIIKPEQFKMITATPKGFDGNGYTIYIEGGAIKVNDALNFGLFEKIKEGAVFKNINIVIKNNLTFSLDNTYASSGVNFGLLTAQNLGTITNCCIQSESVIFINVLGTISITETSNLGTLCAINSGYITNSQIIANITVNGSSVGGLVSKNDTTGYISSCYVKKSRIFNTTSVTSEKIVTAGLCSINLGKISLSFVEGTFTDKMYCTYEKDNHGLASKIIYTSTLTAGFVYENSGTILDSYSNIPIVSSSRCSGFVGINKEGGIIERTYSLSQMKKNDTLNYGYVINYEQGSSFKDCFFVIENGFINAYTAESNYKYENGVYSEKIPGIKPLEIKDFNIYDSTGKVKQDTPFKNFIISKNENVRSGVWFAVYQKDEESKYILDRAYSVAVNELSVYDKNTNKFIPQTFSSRRLHLVSPNYLAYSKMLIKEKDGEYEYYNEEPSLNQGSQYNPYLISDAVKLENYLNNSKMYEYFRIIKNIDYLEDNLYTSSTYNKSLLGYIEGNNFKIANYAINSKTSLSYSGFISQFGNNSRSKSIMKNITFEPTYINLPNSIIVGAVAGNVTNSCIYNVSVSGKNLVVTGKNVVGGLFGQTTGMNDISNISSNITAKATKYSTSLELKKNDIEALIKDISYNTTSSNRDSISYAGSLIGYVSGETEIINANVGELAKSYAIISGLLFGGVGELSTISHINIQLNSFNNEVKAFAFGGIISGELKGTVSNVKLESNILTKNLFSCYPITPIAIGGISGLINGGIVTNINSEEGYSVIGTAFSGNYITHENSGLITDKIKNPYIARYVGGIAGYLRGVSRDSLKQSISNVTINKLIVSGGNYVGGIVGYANNDGLKIIIDKIDVNLTGHKLYINQDNQEIDELVYTSYVSQFVSENLADYEFNDNQRFGFAIGMLADYTEMNFVNITDNVYTTLQEDGTDNVGLYCCYASYGKKGSNNVCNIVASDTSISHNEQDCYSIYLEIIDYTNSANNKIEQYIYPPKS